MLTNGLVVVALIPVVFGCCVQESVHATTSERKICSGFLRWPTKDARTFSDLVFFLEFRPSQVVAIGPNS